ncbi:hypothetical protein BC834DRAFT_454457 [Gloeopeniophorella convolvens]|nr:hypothetical protein BC834DRAFT_454457 [Gloeopeniophorella convolvens]
MCNRERTLDRQSRHVYSMEGGVRRWRPRRAAGSGSGWGRGGRAVPGPCAGARRTQRGVQPPAPSLRRSRIAHKFSSSAGPPSQRRHGRSGITPPRSVDGSAGSSAAAKGGVGAHCGGVVLAGSACTGAVIRIAVGLHGHPTKAVRCVGYVGSVPS